MQTRTWKPSKQASSVVVGRLTPIVRSVHLLAPRSRFVASVQACLTGPGTLPSSNGVNTHPVASLSSEVTDVKTPHVSGFNWAPMWRVLKSISRVMAVAAVVVVLQNCLMPGQAMAAATAGSATQSSGGNVLASALDFVLHLDHHLSGLIEQHGKATYWLFFAIVFAETGLVLTPFLPGDSLLFAAGAFAGMGKLNVWTLMAVFITSAILGDAVNYAVGNRLGGWAAEKNLVKQEYIQKTEKFYAKYGGKTVVLARFVPIIRTFAPFVAGVGSMSYSNFAAYNVFGAVLWTVLFVGGGFFFGNLPFVQKNFTLVVLGIIVVSVVPVIIEIINARREGEADQGTNNGKPV